MSRNRKSAKTIQKYYKIISGSIAKLKKLLLLLLRTFVSTKRKPRSANAGFVLPTVAMVSIVVVLLTVAIVFRSFERSKNASNVRVDEAVVNAAMPALDRASAKLEQLLNDPSLPRSTPTDVALYDVIKNNSKYNFGDETRLKLAYPINGLPIQADLVNLQNDETLNTAWMFPVDTDNNGKFDTYTLYAIYFRSPPRGTVAGSTEVKFSRERNPLEARTPPMDRSQISGACAVALGTSASLVGDSDWYKSGGILSKSFFVYTVNIPIDNTNLPSGTAHEVYQGNKGFSALEYQQDRERIPVNNKAVWFENDLEITPGTALTLNGAVHTNANFLAGGKGVDITFRQVSSKNSCFYEQESAKITIGGNFGTSNVSETLNRNPLVIDLFQGYKANPFTGKKIGNSATDGGKSTTENGGRNLGHNDAAYNLRINKMKEEALGLCTTCYSQTTVAGLKTTVDGISRYPDEVKKNFTYRVDQTANIDVKTAYKIFSDELELYLRNRTSRVPYARVSQATPTLTQALIPYSPTANVLGSTGIIEVPPEWREITTTNTGLTLNLNQLPATEPEKQKENGKENLTGDRILIGNNLPAYWKNDQGKYVGGEKARQKVDNGTTKWNDPNTKERTRASQVQPQLNLGVTDRNDFWEQKAAESKTNNPLANVGGMRVVTGAGIYVDDDGITRSGETPSYSRSTNSFLPSPTSILSPTVTTPGVAGLDPDFVNTNGSTTAGKMPMPAQFTPNGGTAQTNIVVWSDSMPMTHPNVNAPAPNTETRKGDLLMRASAVYHYAVDAGPDQEPIACVSSYYDPTNATTALNNNSLPSGVPNRGVGGRSNNGVVYSFPSGARTNTADLTTLIRQARLVYPNGRIVNEPLRNAMQKYAVSNSFANFTMADYSAVDAGLCAINILRSPLTGISTSRIAHGTIKEASFLDAREVKALQNQTSYQTASQQGQYDLDLEQRHPLEIRVTEIDVGILATTAVTGTSEYLLPMSGIIYATRDDALADASYSTVVPTADPEEVKLLSQTDYKLDPSRRPNGIRLINGSNLARTGTNTTYDPSEKGLILVSNLPVYVKGNFNLHQNTAGGAEIQEFSDTTSSFYDQANGEPNFACRLGRTGCSGTGDLWRPATIISDAVTLLSGNTPATGFQDGFRDQGDFDLRNNGITLPNSTLVNNFVTSASWANTSGLPNARNSYLTNGVTPIQRRVNFNEYLMEICVKVPASTCNDTVYDDWHITAPPDQRVNTGGVKIHSIDTTASTSSPVVNSTSIATTFQAGTTAQPAAPGYQHFRRRVAFLRNNTGQLLNASGNVITNGMTGIDRLPVPLGIDANGRVAQFPYNSAARPRLSSTILTPTMGLWFRTTDNNSNNPTITTDASYNNNKPLFIQSPLPIGTAQPQLVPVLQIFSPNTDPSIGNNINQGNKTPGIQLNWVQQATVNTTFNIGFVAGNSPSRPDEESGGLPNFVRFLEDWGGDGRTQYEAKVRGSFIQFKRSSYATAPFANVVTATANANGSATNELSFFNYPFTTYWTNKGDPNGTLPYFTPPTRNWGFDVALLSQLPDLFAQKFTVPPSGAPSEYFRQVSQDDPWVKTLLCAKKATGTTWSDFVAPQKYRTGCPSGNYP